MTAILQMVRNRNAGIHWFNLNNKITMAIRLHAAISPKHMRYDILYNDNKNHAFKQVTTNDKLY